MVAILKVEHKWWFSQKTTHIMWARYGIPILLKKRALLYHNHAVLKEYLSNTAMPIIHISIALIHCSPYLKFFYFSLGRSLGIFVWEIIFHCPYLSPTYDVIDISQLLIWQLLIACWDQAIIWSKSWGNLYQYTIRFNGYAWNGSKDKNLNDNNFPRSQWGNNIIIAMVGEPVSYEANYSTMTLARSIKIIAVISYW